MNFNKTLAKLLGNDKKIEEIQVDQKVVDEIIKIARNADPNEYVALLSGKADKHILKITGLIFLPYESSSTSAVMQIFMMPMTTHAVGSVHSHPGPSNQPSDADLQFFSKNGVFHMIICQPYTAQTIGAYDQTGMRIPFSIKDLGEDMDIKNLEDFDIEDGFDPEFIEEMQKEEQENTTPDNLDTDDEIEIIEEKDDIMDENNNNINEPQKPHAIDIELEVNGQIVHRRIPLPEEYELGDDIEVDICTDKTEGDSIDDIKINVLKNPQYNTQVLDVNSTKPVRQETDKPKTKQEVEKDIAQMESDIARLKRENEELKRNLNKKIE